MTEPPSPWVTDFQTQAPGPGLKIKFLTAGTPWGTPRAGTMYGFGSDDIIFGLKGDDRMYGDSGDDVLWGSYDDDKLYGRFGADDLYGMGGDDYLSANDGKRDLVNCGSGRNWFNTDSFDVGRKCKVRARI
jgi:Ca2+-binding RTX toxin-like protein